MFSKLKIGDMANLNDISIQTLRHYEKKGLLSPVEVDELTGYRYYAIEQSARLDLIQFLKALNFSLEETKELLEMSQDSLDLKLEEKEAELLEIEKDIQYKLSLIRSLKQTSNQLTAFRQKDEIEFVKFPKRYLYTFPIERNIYSMTIDEYEYYLRLFKQHLNAKKFPIVFNCIGSILEREKFLRCDLTSKQMCIMLLTPNQYPLHNYTLKAGMYAVAYCDSFEKEVPVLKEFREELFRQGHEVLGDYVCEVVYEFPLKENPDNGVQKASRRSKREMLIRLQVRVKE